MPAEAIGRTQAADFVRDHTDLLAPPLIPEIRLHTASELTPIWEATEADFAEMGLPPPFWAFAWAGGQALARYILDNPDIVAGKRVLDFAAGGGLSAIAATRAGAAKVTANEIDPYAGAAIALNAVENGVSVEVVIEDIVGSAVQDWDIVLAGDICYEKSMAARIFAWLREIAGTGRPVLMGDPNRTYLPKSGLVQIARYTVETTRAIEDTDVRNAIVWQVKPE